MTTKFVLIQTDIIAVCYHSSHRCLYSNHLGAILLYHFLWNLLCGLIFLRINLMNIPSDISNMPKISNEDTQKIYKNNILPWFSFAISCILYITTIERTFRMRAHERYCENRHLLIRLKHRGYFQSSCMYWNTCGNVYMIIGINGRSIRDVESLRLMQFVYQLGIL